MHYYQHHLGDYSLATGHLGQTEHGAYRQLLDFCYANERPLPAKIEAIYHICRSSSRGEKEAARSVLEEFFQLTDAGYIHRRVVREIEAFHGKNTAASNAGKASAAAKKRGKTPESPDVPQQREAANRSTEVQRTVNGHANGSSTEIQRDANQPRTINQEPSVLLGKEPKLQGLDFPPPQQKPEKKQKPARSRTWNGDFPLGEKVADGVRAFYRRRPGTPWSQNELKHARTLAKDPSKTEAVLLSDLQDFETARKAGMPYGRTSAETLLGHWQAEVDKVDQFLNPPPGVMPLGSAKAAVNGRMHPGDYPIIDEFNKPWPHGADDDPTSENTLTLTNS